MDSIQYAEAIVREFLVYRGFAQTLRVFDSEVANDKANGFQVDRIVELIFGVYIARFEAEKLVSMLSFLNERFFSRIDARYYPTVKKLDSSIKRYYIVHALQRGRSDKVLQFFESYGEALLLSGDEWQIWFALPYIKNAHLDPRFQLYFTKEWLDTLIISFRNFLCQVFDGIRLPTMLKFNAERVKRQALAREVEELRKECARLKLLAENREKETNKLRRHLAAGHSQSPPPGRDGGIMMMTEEGRYSPELSAGVLRPRYSGLGGASAGSFPAAPAGNSSGESRGRPAYGSPPTSGGGDRRPSRLSYLDMAVLESSGHLRKDRSSPRSSRLTSRGQGPVNRLSTNNVDDCTVTGRNDDDSECVGQSDYVASTSYSRNGISTPIAVNEPGCDFPRDQEGRLGDGIDVTGNQDEDSCVEGDDGRASVLTAEGEFSGIDVQSQIAFSGHTSPITRCRLSVSGANVASASVDGTVRIWTYEVGVPTTRNATLYCGAEVLSLEWDSKSDRLLLMGTAEGGIKAWNVDAKRVVCDLSVDPSFPRVVDIKGSPTDAAFSCATSSARNAPSSYGSVMSGSQVESIDHPKGTVAIWNMRVWKILNTLVLGEEPPLVMSLCYNHNGKILATAATDGLIRLFDMSSCSLITSWTAHRSCAASCVRFGHNHTSVFTLGSDGNISEWSLHNQSQLLQSFDASKFCSAPLSAMSAHEMAIEPHGRSLLTTSCLSFAPIFSLEGSSSAELPRISQGHGGPITSVDWHPLLPVFITGSEDRSVRVTSL